MKGYQRLIAAVVLGALYAFAFHVSVNVSSA